LVCSAVPTYDEHSQKSGRVYIYFATPDEERVGSVEVDGESLSLYRTHTALAC